VGAGSLALPDPDAALAALEERLGHRFREPALLRRALTHPSFAHEEGGPTEHYERLEFLGDAVLDLVVSELLMERSREADEGVLSRARAAAVNRLALAERARALQLQDCVRLGEGERKSRGWEKPSILADVFEAVLGAIYLDGGLEPVRALIEALPPELRTPDGSERDAKSRLGEALQARGEATPRYEVTREWGPDHAKEFEVAVWIGDRVAASGVGRSKREAEQAAAAEALAALDS
jgi:ribonuclease-3